MLTPSQLSDIKHKNPDLFTLFRVVVEAINKFALQMGVDPRPAPQTNTADAIPAPGPPASISIRVVNQVVLVMLGKSNGTDSVFYFVQRSESAQFTEVEEFALGHSRQVAVPENPGTTYWRAFAKYQMSLRSPFIVWEG